MTVPLVYKTDSKYIQWNKTKNVVDGSRILKKMYESLLDTDPVKSYIENFCLNLLSLSGTTGKLASDKATSDYEYYSVKSNNKTNRASNYKGESGVVVDNNNFNQKLNPYYVSGFSAGEGCFSVGLIRNNTLRTGWEVRPCFAIHLHGKDFALLKEIQAFFGVGSISTSKSGSVSYQVQSVKDIANVLIPHFDKYLLLTKKQADFLLFKSIVELILCKKHLTSEGLEKIISISASINTGLNERVVESFPSIIPIESPLIAEPEYIEPLWLLGFIEAEGCFFAGIFQKTTNKTGYSVQLRFSISQHSRDHLLMASLKNLFNCGTVMSGSNESIVQFRVSSFNDIINKIIPFLDQYPLQGSKRLDYFYFSKIVVLMKQKSHLTVSGLEEIRAIKSKMNRGRT